MRCTSCAADVLPDDRFCEVCGTPVGTACMYCESAEIGADGYCEMCGRRQSRDRDHVEIDLEWAAGVSDKGKRHHRNEDAMVLCRATVSDGVAVVAVVSDGVSTSARADEASQAAVDTAAAAFANTARDTDPVTATKASAARAVRAVAALGSSGDDPSCTYVSALVTAEAVTVGWVGDSRAYWLAADGSSVRLTDDDSWANDMVAAGRLTVEQAYADPRAHILTRWLGIDAGDVAAGVVTFQPTGPGVVLVCSDGLWNYLPEASELAAAALPDAYATPLRAARTLVQHALDAGGHDNITATLVPFPPRGTGAGR